MNEIQVRIRHADDTESVPLCTWDGSKLDALITELGRWGIYQDSSGLMSEDFTGQFVITNKDAYFEVIVGLGDGS